MKTQLDIINYYIAHKEQDMLGFMAEAILPYLSVEQVKTLFPDADLKDWVTIPLTEADVIEDARKYMEFAWDKALNHRGISASRSIQKMQGWMWLLGKDELSHRCEKNEGYAPYGAPILAAICREMGWPIPSDEITQRMILGKSCHETCDEGCDS